MEKEERERKKKWTTPQLIVLVRGKPEEGVLLVCKTAAGVAGPESATDRGACSAIRISPGCIWCAFKSES